MTLTEFMTLFFSTNSLLFQPDLINSNLKRPKGTSNREGMYLFFVVKSKYLSVQRGRSPPVNQVIADTNLIDWRNEYERKPPEKKTGQI